MAGVALEAPEAFTMFAVRMLSIMVLRYPDKSWDQKVYRRDQSVGRRSIVVWGM